MTSHGCMLFLNFFFTTSSAAVVDAHLLGRSSRRIACRWDTCRLWPSSWHISYNNGCPAPRQQMEERRKRIHRMTMKPAAEARNGQTSDQDTRDTACSCVQERGQVTQTHKQQVKEEDSSKTYLPAGARLVDKIRHHSLRLTHRA